jgi:hypothetical protein
VSGPFGSGDPGSGNGPSGGDQSGQDSGCPQDDPICGPYVPNVAPTAPSIGSNPPAQPFPAGLVPSTSYVTSNPNAVPNASVIVTYQLVDHNGNPMLMEGATIELPISNTKAEAGTVGFTTNSDGQITAPYPMLGDTSGFTNTQNFYYLADPNATSLPNQAIETVRWTANIQNLGTGISPPLITNANAPPGFYATGTNSLGQQNFKLP